MCSFCKVSQNTAPHCSLMAYVADEKCREIYMATHSSTMKYQNLLHNPAVSLLIDSRESTPRQQAQALTVSGIFQPIDDKNKKERVEAQLLRRHPHLKEFTKNPDTVLICIKVQSFLLLDGLTDAHFVNLKQI
ncbi:pyridoxamine 5'-phosphate oxidase family protein [Thermodesulfobacteriota bacterium]